MRAISGQNVLFSRTIHDMAYNPVRDEIVVPSFLSFAILTFRGDANGNVPPIRRIFGPDTQLKSPERLAIDPVHGEIFVPQEKAVMVFPLEADGNTKPIRVIEGPDTQIGSGSAAVTVDPVHNVLIMFCSSGRQGGQLLIFNRTDEGNAKPRSVIKGPKTMLRSSGTMDNYPPRGYVVVAARGNEQASPDSFVGVWSIYDNGDVAPRWTIGGPNGLLRRPRGVTLDPESKNVIVGDKYLNSVLTWHVPEIF